MSVRVRTLAFVVLSLTAALVPSALVVPSWNGACGWVCFVVSAVFAAAAIRSHSDGYVFGTAALFAAIALKDAVFVVESAYVNVFHVVLTGLLFAVLYDAWHVRCISSDVHESSCSRLPPPVFRRPKGAEWGLIALPCAGLWSLAASVAPWMTIAHVARLLLLAGVALLVARLLSDERSRRCALRAFVYAAVPLAVFAVLQWLFPDVMCGNVHRPWSPPGIERGVRPAAFYIDPNFLAAHLLAASLVALGLAQRSRRWYVWVTLAAGLLGVVAITFSRSAWLAAGAGIVVLAVIGGRRVRRLSIAAVAVTVVLGLCLIGGESLADRARSILDTETSSSNVTRILMMRSSCAMIADYPVFGTGFGAFDVVYPAYMLEGANANVTHPHQVLLPTIAETGIGGVAAILLLLFSGGRALVRVCMIRAPYEQAIVAVIVALGVASFFQYILFFEVAWLFAGLLVSAEQDSAKDCTGRSGTNT